MSTQFLLIQPFINTTDTLVKRCENREWGIGEGGVDPSAAGTPKSGWVNTTPALSLEVSLDPSM